MTKSGGLLSAMRQDRPCYESSNVLPLPTPFKQTHSDCTVARKAKSRHANRRFRHQAIPAWKSKSSLAKSMMASRKKRSNQGPDRLMQDRAPPNQLKLLAALARTMHRCKSLALPLRQT